MVPYVRVDDSTFNINGNNVTLALSWGEPFNNFDPIVNYTVSCSGDVTCPPNFTTTDNTTRSYTITNLTLMTDYTFSVVATNSIGSGKAIRAAVSTPPGKGMLCRCNFLKYMVTTDSVFNFVHNFCMLNKFTKISVGRFSKLTSAEATYVLSKSRSKSLKC